MEIGTHRVIMEERHGAEITGVSDLLIFDENEIVVQTVMGLLTIHGQDLHISNLDLERGSVLLTGELREVYYEEESHIEIPKNNGFFSKMLHG